MAFVHSTTFPSLIGPSFQDLGSDPTTRTIWYTLAIVHDYESASFHDNTNSRLKYLLITFR